MSFDLSSFTIGMTSSQFNGERGIPTVNAEILLQLIKQGQNSFLVVGDKEENTEFKEKCLRLGIEYGDIKFIEAENRINDPIEFLQKSSALYEACLGEADLFWYGKNYGCQPFNENSIPIVVTVHDILGLARPDLQGGTVNDLRTTERALKMSSLQSADVIVTVSEFTRSEILRLLPHLSHKEIRVIYNGVNRDVFYPLEADKRQDLKQKLGLPEKFILHAGAYNTYKNIAFLIDAFSISGLASHGWKFLLIGPESNVKGNNKAELQSYVQHRRLSSSVYFRPSEKCYYGLSSLYQTAGVTLSASLYEGFGLSLLEAMSCRCPVIPSDIPPHRELIGNSLALVSPCDIEAFAQRMRELCLDTEFNYNEAQRAHQRSSLFSWEKSANHYQALFKSLIRKAEGKTREVNSNAQLKL